MLSSSERKTTAAPILAFPALATSASSCLTRLAKASSVLRAKTMTTDLPPNCQTRQFCLPFWLADSELKTFRGLKGVIPLPTCGPDFRSLASTTVPQTASATNDPTKTRLVIVETPRRRRTISPQADTPATAQTQSI